MKCNQILPLLSAHLDGANSEIEERRLQQHLKTCRRCRELLAQMEENDALLASQEAQPPVELTTRIMEQVRKEEKKPRFGKNFLISTAATGLAAAALLAFVVWGNVSLPGFSESSVEKTSFDLAPEVTYNDTSDPAAADADDGSAALSDTLTGALDPSGSDTDVSGGSPSDNDPLTAATQPTQATQPTEKSETVTAVTGEPTEVTEPAADEPTQDTYFEPSPPPTANRQNESTTDEAVEPPPMYPYTGSTEETAPPKRGVSKQEAVEGPVLVIWKTDTAEIAGLSGCKLSPAEPASAEVLGDNLYTRMNNGLFLRPHARDDGQETTLAVTTCTVDYETLTALFDECAGTYELCVYYPASIKTLEKCTVLLVSLGVAPAPTE